MQSSLGLEGLPCFGLLAASIRKSGLEIKNRCTVCPCFDLMAASIRKSRPEIENRCTDCPCFDLLAASIRKFGLEIENRCSAIVPASRTARLQQSRGAQAGTGCHEGGIILSKKPPEWCLSLPSHVACDRFYSSLPQRTTARVRFYSSLPQRRSGEMGMKKEADICVNLLLMNCQPLNLVG